MSLAIENIKAFRVLDPRTDINQERYYRILQGGREGSVQPQGATTYSNTGIAFQSNVSTGIILDRLMWVEVPIRITLTSNNTGTPGIIYDPNAGTMSLRALPLSAISGILQVQINGTSFNIELYKVLRHLMRFYGWSEKFCTSLSGMPSELDQDQVYTASGQPRNPMRSYANSDCYSNPRGTYPITIVSDNGTTCVLDTVIYEPIFVSPFIWGSDEEPGLVGVNNLQVNYNFHGNFQQIWSSADPVAGQIAPILGVSISIPNQPQLYITQITPRENQSIPKNPIYSSFYLRDYTTSAGTVNASSSSSVNTNTIQLSSIPSMIYFAVRVSDSSYVATTTDTYARLTGVTVQLDNNAGQLSTYGSFNLWNMSVVNGLKLSWPQFYSKVGSIIAINPARDLGLTLAQAPGVGGKYNLQIRASFTNISSKNLTFEAHIITVSEGILTITGPSSATQQEGILTPEDVVNSETLPSVPKRTLYSLYGGDFVSSIKSIYDKVKPFYNKAKPALKVAADIAQFIPGPHQTPVAVARKILGVGKPTHSKSKHTRKSTRSKHGSALLNENELENQLEELDLDDSE